MARQDNNLDAVQFTRESAERIAGVVRAAELSPAVASPLDFGRRVVDQRIPKQVRAATFTGSWSVGASKVVTFKYAPTATANVTNLSWPITHNHSAAENCVVGKEGTSWWLVVPVLQTATAVFVTQTQAQELVTGVTVSTSTINYLSSISVYGTLDTSSCAITIVTNQTTASSNVVSGVTASTASMTVIQQTVTASYLRLRVS
jgi:hypothetical protein